MPRRRNADVFVVTEAPEPRSADVARRTNSYLLKMGLRTCLLVVAIFVPGPLRWVAVVGAVFLPLLSVITANAAPVQQRLGATFVTADSGRALGTSAVVLDAADGSVVEAEPTPAGTTGAPPAATPPGSGPTAR